MSSLTSSRENLDQYWCMTCSQGFHTYCELCGILITTIEHRSALGSHALKHNTVQSKRPRIRHARAGPRASQACRSCAAAKAKCDNGLQCNRCLRKKLPCIRSHQNLDEQGSSVMALESSQIDLGTRAVPLLAQPQQRLEETHQQVDILTNPEETLGLQTPVSTLPLMLDNQDSFAIYNTSCFNLSNGLTEPSSSQRDWDFGMTYNMFDPENNIDITPMAAPGNASFPSTPLNLQQQREDTEEQELEGDVYGVLSPPSSIAPKIIQSISDTVFEAFQQSIGLWRPEKRHYRAVEESHLSIGETVPTSVDCLGRFDVQIFCQSLPTSIRDRMIAAIARSCDPNNLINVTSGFPAAEILDRLLKAFMTQHASCVSSYIHIPTFQVSECRLELLVACVSAAAAMSPSRPVQMFGLAMQEFLVYQLWATSEKANVLVRDLEFLQAFALHLHVGLWSGLRRKMEMAGSFLGIITNATRGSGRFRRASYTQLDLRTEDDGEVLAAKWKHWAREESFKRLIYHIYIHTAQEAVMTSGTSCISYSELMVPVPQCRKLWFAKSAQEWKSIYLGLRPVNQDRQPCLPDLLADTSMLTTLGEFYDQNLAQHCLLYAVSCMIRRHRQDMTVFRLNSYSTVHPGAVSDELQYHRILHILDALRPNDECGDNSAQMETGLIADLLFMHLFAPFDQIELVAGKEGRAEAERAYPALQPWICTSNARKAVWHAGQVLRATNKLPCDQMLQFHAIAAYHASLCIWIYGVLLLEADAKGYTNLGSGSSGSAQHEVVLDGDESICTQRWINYNRGVPTISIGMNEQKIGGHGNGTTVPIRIPRVLIETLMRKVAFKFSGFNSPLVENICHLMQALGNVHQDDRAAETEQVQPRDVVLSRST